MPRPPATARCRPPKLLLAQRAFQAALPGLQAASAEPLLWEPEIRRRGACSSPHGNGSRHRPGSACRAHLARGLGKRILPPRLEAEFYLAPSPSRPLPAHRDQRKALCLSAEDGGERPALAERPWSVDAIEPVEPDLPIHAKLIEFPRELVATRKRRPRRAEGPFAAQGLERQLSIFEVDPGALFIQPEAAGAAHAWPNPEWSRIELEAQPLDEPEPQDAPVSLPILQQASTGRRLTAALVDGALIAGACLGSALGGCGQYRSSAPGKNRGTQRGFGAPARRPALSDALFHPGRCHAGHEVRPHLPMHLRRPESHPRAVAPPVGCATTVRASGGAGYSLDPLRRRPPLLARPAVEDLSAQVLRVCLGTRLRAGQSPQ